MKELLVRFQAWRSQLSSREQNMLYVTIIMVLWIVLYWGAWKPLNNKVALVESNYTSAQTLNSWLTKQANVITQLRKSGGATPDQSQPFNQVISTSTGRYHIQLIRIQPRDDMNQVWIEPIAFNSLVTWLDYLNKQYGINVDSLDIERSDVPGVVEVKRLVLR